MIIRIETYINEHAKMLERNNVRYRLHEKYYLYLFIVL